MQHPPTQHKRAPTLRRWLGQDLPQLAALLLLLAAARDALANHYHVPSASMEYSLMPGDRVVVDVHAYGLRLPFTRIPRSKGRRRLGAIARYSTRLAMASA